MKILFVMFLVFSSVYASKFATATKVSGKVIAKKAGEFISIQTGAELDDAMVLMTQKDSSVTLIFSDMSKMVLGANAVLNLKKYIFQPQKDEYEFDLFLEEGALSFESGKISDLAPEKFTLKTPDGTVAIRGTKFFVKVQ